MNYFFRENKILVVGILLPIIMMVIFGLASVIPKYLVSPPQYDLLVATDNYNVFVKFDVVNGKLKAQYVCNNNCNVNPTRPILYIFEAKSQKTREIKFDFPTIPNDTKSFSSEIIIPELQNVTIDTSTVAPDGYSYNSANYYYGDILSELFIGNNDRRPEIVKNGNVVSILPKAKGYSYYQIKFIGWIVSKQGK
jgi:hypothetical protein